MAPLLLLVPPYTLKSSVAYCEELNMDMDLTKFWFFVIPGWLCFVGALFTLIFGNDLLRLYRERLAFQKSRNAAAKTMEVPEYVERTPRDSKKELVGSH